METKLVSMPELTFEPSYGCKYGKEREEREWRVGKRDRERRKDLLFSLLARESSLLQRVSRRVCCSRTLCHCGGIAELLLFVIVHCSLGLNLAAAKGFSEMDSTG